MITVHSRHHDYPAEHEWIGYPRTLNIPFVLGVDGSREECMAKYKLHLWKHMKSKQGKIYQKLLELKRRADAGDLNLLCACKPLLCHGDIIKAAIEFMQREDYE